MKCIYLSFVSTTVPRLLWRALSYFFQTHKHTHTHAHRHTHTQTHVRRHTHIRKRSCTCTRADSRSHSLRAYLLEQMALHGERKDVSSCWYNDSDLDSHTLRLKYCHSGSLASMMVSSSCWLPPQFLNALYHTWVCAYVRTRVMFHFQMHMWDIAWNLFQRRWSQAIICFLLKTIRMCVCSRECIIDNGVCGILLSTHMCSYVSLLLEEQTFFLNTHPKRTPNTQTKPQRSDMWRHH